MDRFPGVPITVGWTYFQLSPDHKQLKSYLKAPDTYVFKVVDSRTNQTIGHISLGKIDTENESARIGKVMVNPSQRGQDIGTKMIKALLNFAFLELNLHKVSLGVFDFNESAIRCYEKAGFKIDGLLRDHRKINDKFWNLYEMSLLLLDWKN